MANNDELAVLIGYVNETANVIAGYVNQTVNIIADLAAAVPQDVVTSVLSFALSWAAFVTALLLGVLAEGEDPMIVLRLHWGLARLFLRAAPVLAACVVLTAASPLLIAAYVAFRAARYCVRLVARRLRWL